MTTIRIYCIMTAMYVCICNRHRDHEIREAARTGLRCAVEVYRYLGKPPRCGRCLDVAAQVIADVHASEAAVSIDRATAAS